MAKRNSSNQDPQLQTNPKKTKTTNRANGSRKAKTYSANLPKKPISSTITSKKRKAHDIFLDIVGSFNDVLKNQTLPAVPDYDDAWFAEEWQDLYYQIAQWCYTGYRCIDGHRCDYKDWMGSKNKAQLTAVWIRDVVTRASVTKRLNDCDPNNDFRVYTCIALTYRILHEVVFEGMRGFLKTELPDPAKTWIDKEQPIHVFNESTQTAPGPCSFDTPINPTTNWRTEVRKMTAINENNGLKFRYLDSGDYMSFDLLAAPPRKLPKYDIFKSMDECDDADNPGIFFCFELTGSYALPLN
jgi:hypothetical protein